MKVVNKQKLFLNLKKLEIFFAYGICINSVFWLNEEAEKVSTLAFGMIDLQYLHCIKTALFYHKGDAIQNVLQMASPELLVGAV